jgi:hypothetical protein
MSRHSRPRFWKPELDRGARRRLALEYLEDRRSLALIVSGNDESLFDRWLRGVTPVVDQVFAGLDAV